MLVFILVCAVKYTVCTRGVKRDRYIVKYFLIKEMRGKYVICM